MQDAKQQAAAEQRRRDEERRDAARRAEQEKKDAARRKADEQKEAARRKEEERKEALRRADEERQQGEARRKQALEAAARQKVSEKLKEALDKQREAELKRLADQKQQELQRFLATYQQKSVECQLVELAYGADSSQAKACVLKDQQAELQRQPVSSGTNLAPAPKQGGTTVPQPGGLTREQFEFLKQNAVRLQPEQRTLPGGNLSPTTAPFPRPLHTFSNPGIRPDPTEPRTATERKAQMEAYARAREAQNRLWPVTDNEAVGARFGVDHEKLKYDWDTVNLARAAYSSRLEKGDAVFKGRNDWTVLDVRTDERSGFHAYTFLNKEKGSIVVGIQGSSPFGNVTRTGAAGADARADWGQDIGAYLLNRKPEQFDLAKGYIHEIKQQYGQRFTIACAGHSMGGGACGYAASELGGVHGVALDPITFARSNTPNAYLIDNYVTAGEIADNMSALRLRTPSGWGYGLPLPTLNPAPSGMANTTPSAVGDGVGAIRSHNVDVIVGQLARESGQSVWELSKP